MPGPDPLALSYDETPSGAPIVRAEIRPQSGPFAGNRKHRNARALAVLRRLQRNGWACPHCGDPVPLWRRADAVFCSLGCKKRAKRARQALGGGGPKISGHPERRTAEIHAPMMQTQVFALARFRWGHHARRCAKT